MENEKEGPGTLYFVNSDSITGHFVHGQPHGLMKVVFSAKGRVRYAEYVRGVRVAWVKKSRGLSRATTAISLLQEDVANKQQNTAASPSPSP